MNKVFYRTVCAVRFGGIKYLLAGVKDKILHTKNRRTLTREIIRNLDFDNCEKEAAAYFGMETGQKINYANPKRFNEKIQWYMIHDNSDLKADLTDKYKVRAIVEQKIGKDKLIPLLGVWNKFEDIDLDTLPDKFVLKCNHGSGMNIVVKGKNRIDCKQIKQKFDEWMNTNFAYNNFELHYGKIIPKILAEKYIEELDGNLFDYKVHCFNGEPKFIQVIGDRDLNAHTARQLIYDFNWEIMNWSFGDYPKYNNGLARPNKLNQLYELSKILSEGFDYVRTDFYILGEHILFGEMTFTPNSGLYIYNQDFTQKVDLMLGQMIEMNDIDK